MSTLLHSPDLGRSGECGEKLCGVGRNPLYDFYPSTGLKTNNSLLVWFSWKIVNYLILILADQRIPIPSVLLNIKDEQLRFEQERHTHHRQCFPIWFIKLAGNVCWKQSFLNLDQIPSKPAWRVLEYAARKHRCLFLLRQKQLRVHKGLFEAMHFYSNEQTCIKNRSCLNERMVGYFSRRGGRNSVRTGRNGGHQNKAPKLKWTKLTWIHREWNSRLVPARVYSGSCSHTL